jgi:hypothetical protein
VIPESPSAHSRDPALEVIEPDVRRKGFHGKPVRNQPLRSGGDSAGVLELHASPKARIRGVAGTRNFELRQERKKLAQALRPALRKIDVLGMRDLQRRVEWGEPQRHIHRPEDA